MLVRHFGVHCCAVGCDLPAGRKVCAFWVMVRCWVAQSALRNSQVVLGNSIEVALTGQVGH